MTATPATDPLTPPGPDAPDAVSKSRVAAVAVSVLVLLVCCCAAAYWVYSFVAGPTASTHVVGTDDPPTRHGNPRFALQFRADQLDEPDGFHDRRGNQYIKAGKYRLTIVRHPKADPTLMVLPIITETLITPDQSETRAMAQRVIADPKVAEYAKVTPDQVKQLRPLVAGKGMAITDDEEAKFQELFKSFDTAKGSARAAPQQAIIDLIRSAAPKAVEPTKKALADRTAAIQSVLTSSQIDALRNMGR